MMIRLLCIVVCFSALVQAGMEVPLAYPGLFLCSDNNQPPVASCRFRSSLKLPFEDCGNGVEMSLNFVGEVPRQVPCLVFNTDLMSRLAAADFGSIITFNSTMNVHWATLFDPEDGIPSEADSYSSLIYMYDDAGLISITGKTTFAPKMYATTLHTHHYGVAPQDIWVRFDPTYREIQ